MKIDNVADLIVETLAQAGVKRIFGVPTSEGRKATGLSRSRRRCG
jgi:hypothetical protein